MTARVYNGEKWHEVPSETHRLGGNDHGSKFHPLPPILNGDGKIFVSIASFRDGERCGKTIVDLFAKAKDPDKIIVGLVDQSYEEDAYCLEVYCRELGHDIFEKKLIRDDTTKIIAKPERGNCPRIDQIRKLSVHNVAAKGPVWARSMTRKLLGNEEFCLQIDAHSQFVTEWDEKVKHEWAATGNEFGIISTVPEAMGESESSLNTVPRQCSVQFQEIGTPTYAARGDGKVENLQKPLLSHAWSAGFSFSKCHLEESAPYDSFTPFVMGVEQFARFARFWTRGYDVYTPTQNIIFHSYQSNPEGHGPMEWLKPRFERFRQASLRRIRTTLELPDDLEGYNRANLGIYGLGKRRTLQQLAEFVNIDMETRSSRSLSIPCGEDVWIPYDSNISPVENLYDKPDNLDPQPEFPLRSQLVFYKEGMWDPPQLEISEEEARTRLQPAQAVNQESQFPSALLLLLMWLLGLILWCATFLRPATPALRKRKGSKGKKSNSKAKIVKNV